MEGNEDVPPALLLGETANITPGRQDGEFASVALTQDEVSQKAPADTDYHRPMRQKRRRTSPQDQAILEAEFEKNSKPDKSARISIVNRVSLGEKEVQIWFQNRRQMTRRKSRPLSPHEVLSKLSSGQTYCNITPSSSDPTTVSSQQHNSSSQESHISSDTTASVHSDSALNHHLPDGDVVSALIAPRKGSMSTSDLEANSIHERTTGASDKTVITGPVIGQPQAPSIDLRSTLPKILPTKRRPGYFANRRSASFMIHDEAILPQVSAPNLSEHGNLDQNPEKSVQPLKRTPSVIRLSTSLEGKAEVTTSKGTTPSPPRSQPIPVSQTGPRLNTGLQRSHSAFESSNKPAHASTILPIPRRPMNGRSRDSRTWEFYCDNDARNALTEQAEREESGSATAAISLIRSCSQKKKAMISNPNKRNAHSAKLDSSKRMKAEGQKPSKPKLSRATSSVARMQTTTNHTEKGNPGSMAHQKSKSGFQTDIFQDGEGDSDKENWQPGTQTRNPPRCRPAKSLLPARVLEESLQIPSQSGSLATLIHRNSSTAISGKSSIGEDKENSGPEVDDEVAAFMNESAPREVEDLEGVQNLLSLSQAAWR